MNKRRFMTAAAAVSLAGLGLAGGIQPQTERPDNAHLRVLSGERAVMRIGERSFTVDLYDNPTAADLIAMLPLTVKANDYPGYDEKVLRLPVALSMEGAPPGDDPLMPGPDPEEQRRLAELEAARLSQLFFQARPANVGGSATPAPGFAAPGEPGPRDPRRAFLEAGTDRITVSPDRVEAPASPFLLQAGSVIPAALVTGIRSDLPGQITAQVTQNVYDSPTGAFLLIPQGTRLIGEYDAGITFGQRRVLLVWTRMILPDGRSIVLERLAGADAAGYAGLEDGVDYHWGAVLKAAGLATLLAVGAELVADDEDRLVRAIRDGAQDTVNQVGQRIVERQLQVEPTLTIRPGFPVRVIVARDLVLMNHGG